MSTDHVESTPTDREDRPASLDEALGGPGASDDIRTLWDDLAHNVDPSDLSAPAVGSSDPATEPGPSPVALAGGPPARRPGGPTRGGTDRPPGRAGHRPARRRHRPGDRRSAPHPPRAAAAAAASQGAAQIRAPRAAPPSHPAADRHRHLGVAAGRGHRCRPVRGRALRLLRLAAGRERRPGRHPHSHVGGAADRGQRRHRERPDPGGERDPGGGRASRAAPGRHPNGVRSDAGPRTVGVLREHPGRERRAVGRIGLRRVVERLGIVDRDVLSHGGCGH